MMADQRDNDQREELEQDEVIEAEAREVGAGEASEDLQETEATENLMEAIEALQQELNGCRKEANEYLDGWQRARAEFANYKKRVDREQAQAYQTATGSVIRRYLEIIDDLERALKNRPNSGEEASWANGIELIYRKLVNILESEGVKPMDAEGEMFDPNLHEAVTSEESDSHESGEIIEVLQRGYLLGDRVLRPAVVRVAR